MKTVPALPNVPILRTSNTGPRVDTGSARAGAQKINRILVPIDFSAHSETALRYALDLAGQLGAEVTLLHVIEQIPYSGQWLSPLTLSDFAPSTRHMETALSNLARGHREIGEPMVRIGRAAEEIVATAESAGCDCIVLATHGYTGHKNVSLGSVAQDVVRHATCPVMLVRVSGIDRPAVPHS
jgi:universal stress protein A